MMNDDAMHARRRQHGEVKGARTEKVRHRAERGTGRRLSWDCMQKTKTRGWETRIA